MKIFYFFIFLIVGLFFLSSSFSGDAEVVFFDVGQGDAFVFRTSNDQIILVDGGPDWSALYHLSKWLGFRRREIDIMILSHGHADHISSLPEILKRYKVKKVFLPLGLDSFAGEALLDEAQISTIFFPQEDVCYNLGDDCKLCLSPPGQKFIEAKDKNNLSLAILFDCADLSVFAVGDAYQEREQSLLEVNFFEPVQILKISHHGSKTSSNSDFLKALHPSLALISVGLDNSYDQPHQIVINRLLNMGINIWRTDISGQLRVISNNGQSYYNFK